MGFLLLYNIMALVLALAWTWPVTGSGSGSGSACWVPSLSVCMCVCVCLPKDIAVHIEKQQRDAVCGLSLTLAWSRHTFRGATHTLTAFAACWQLCYAPHSPCVCGIIVSGRTCILMEMDSTAINISKYIQRVRLSYSHLPCVQVYVCQRVCACMSVWQSTC